VHRSISSTSALRLERFSRVVVGSPIDMRRRGVRELIVLRAQKLCLRQNRISHIDFPDSLSETLEDLDLYDNLISHIKGLDGLVKLTSLDLSFNNIKHIKNLESLTNLTDLYFVQNRISRIQGLEKLTKIRNLELAANRIRV
jgi:protein phosphatase 1 regulatory subunit 7